MAEQHGLDVDDELRLLEEKARSMREESLPQPQPVERVQLARHPKRPYTLDYIRSHVHGLRRAARRPQLPR
jgi:acetyl-CoA carboxylase carboxyl transferase subunit alpha